MKKLREWLKVRRNAYLVIQTSNVLVIALAIYIVSSGPHSVSAIINSGLVGFCAAMMISNFLMERVHASNARLIKIAQEQQEMLHEMGQMKSSEIAAELASRMRGEVPVAPPSPPTKH